MKVRRVAVVVFVPSLSFMKFIFVRLCPCGSVSLGLCLVPGLSAIPAFALLVRGLARSCPSSGQPGLPRSSQYFRGASPPGGPLMLGLLWLCLRALAPQWAIVGLLCS